MQLIVKNALEGTSGVTKFRAEVRMFYVGSLTYMTDKFPFQDPLIRNAVIVDPASSKTASMQSLLTLVEQLPASVAPEENRDALCREFCTYQSDVTLPAYDPDERVDVFWAAMEKMTDPATGTSQPIYPSLCRLAKHVLLIPHSNAYCESLFSMVKKMTTDQRSTLGRGKEGHAESSVYEDSHGVRNTLCGLLAGKINIFKPDGVSCFSWKPDADLLKKAKSATYQALNS